VRIVGGLAKGRRLAAPAHGTRPTSDRTREALFNTLGALLDLTEARVLDLYAGSGAVGLEALSRGAREAVLVEANRGALDVLRRNVTAVALPGARVERRPVAAFLGTPASTAFDLAFADPPYDLPDDELAGALAALAGNGWLATDAVLVVERSARSPEPTWPDPVTPVRHKRYGDAVLWYGRRR
jgi:16S rRNA (guanine966-N2)-methyltransferase